MADTTTYTDTRTPFAPSEGEKFRISNTRWTGMWLILSLTDKDEQTHFVTFSTDDTERLCKFTQALGGGANRLLGHWVTMGPDGVVVTESDKPSLRHDGGPTNPSDLWKYAS